MEPPNIYGGKAISNTCFEFLRYVAIVSEDLIETGTGFQVVGGATENARLPIATRIVHVTTNYI